MLIKRWCWYLKLIIAEKPSLARNIIDGIGSHSFKKQDGYYESDEYIVSWAFGHLFGLIDIEEYDSSYNKDEKTSWTLDNLPFCPKEFRFRLKKNIKTKETDTGIKKQFSIIKQLVNRTDVDTIINAGDADREGQIIIDIILNYANNEHKTVMRLWLPDQTPETIKSELKTMKDNNQYKNLANEGYARTYIDWLYGVNLTRYTTVKSGTLLRVGRVIAPVVEAIYDRDMEIKNFISEKYYKVISEAKTNGEIVELVSKTTFKEAEKNEAQELSDKYNSKKAVVEDVNTERKIIPPGKLYSLSKLQGVLGKRYKMSLKTSLNAVQSLYEAGFVTYPRTNTEYMATAEKDKVKSIINTLAKEGYPIVFKDSKSIFDDTKIESHSALTPTTRIPDIGKLSNDEKIVYETIRNRFVAVFCANLCIVNRSTMQISINPYETFNLKGDVMIEKGWTEYDFNEKKDKILPNLNKGDVVNIDFKPIEKETQPPKHYTLETFNNFLKNPFKKEIDEEKESEILNIDTEDVSSKDEEDYKSMLSGLELGTEATRTNIIENAINSKYISLKNNTYYIENAGIFYIETLRKLKINMSKNKTAHIGRLLKNVYKGTSNINDVLEVAKLEIREMMSNKDVSISKPSSINEICKCPACGGSIIKQKWGYGCTEYKTGCKFTINNVIAGKTISENVVKTLITNKKTGVLKGFTSKAGKEFNAALKLCKNEDGLYSVTFDFGPKPEERESVLFKCPNCNNNIINDKYKWKCEKDCGFSVGYIVAGKQLTTQQLKDIVTKGETSIIKGFKSSKGKIFNAALCLEDNKTLKFKF